MPVIRLGRRALGSLPKPVKTTVYYDDLIVGFGLRVSPTGTRTWLVEYRPGAGGRGVSKRRMAIGSFNTLSPEVAREIAKKVLARVELGEDPAAERNAARKAQTVADLLEHYMAEKIRPKRKPRTAVLFQGYIHSHILPAIGSRKAVSLTRADIVRLHQSVGAQYPVTANRLLTVLSAAYTYGVKASLIPKGFPNTAREVERFPETMRERYLSAEELARLGDALRLAETDGLPWSPDPQKKVKHAPKIENRRVKIDPVTIAAIRLLLFTGARLREILNLKWSQVDQQRGLLFLPDSKTGKKVIVLGEAALATLGTIPQTSDYLFPGRERAVNDDCGNGFAVERPRSDLNKPWARITAHAGLEGVRIHDLRHSFASIGAGSGLGLPIIGKLLGHTTASATLRYSHLADYPLRRGADTISSAIAAALDGSG